MTRDEIRQGVLNALLSVVPEAKPAEIDPATSLRDQLDIDSMDFINFIATLDQTLGVDVPESEYGRMATLESSVDYLASRLGVPVSSG
ncbi:MAG TPA: phosphopantetheine-binding protein [Gemmatimonadales bacterium]|nr:phosphopantetheine-binding protein [Gemmatimonadales bacterium]